MKDNVGMLRGCSVMHSDAIKSGTWYRIRVTLCDDADDDDDGDDDDDDDDDFRFVVSCNAGILRRAMWGTFLGVRCAVSLVICEVVKCSVVALVCFDKKGLYSGSIAKFSIVYCSII